MKPVTVRTPVQKRFGDIDIFHHVNNVSQQSYFDLGKTDYFRSVLGKDIMEGEPLIITVSTSTSYMGQIRRDDEIEVLTTVSKIGNKSITLFQQIVCGEEVRSESTSVMVAFDFHHQQSVPVPDAWRSKMMNG